MIISESKAETESGYIRITIMGGFSRTRGVVTFGNKKRKKLLELNNETLQEAIDFLIKDKNKKND